MNTAQEQTQYIDRTIVAKMIRNDLKKNFPKTKFSVRSESYSGGGNINVDWIDGPTKKQVEEIIGKYESKGFDGMIDLAYYIGHYMLDDGTIEVLGTDGTSGSMGVVNAYHNPMPKNARKVHLMTGYLFTNRRISEQAHDLLKSIVMKEYGINDNEFNNSTEMWKRYNCHASDLVYRLSVNTAFYDDGTFKSEEIEESYDRAVKENHKELVAFYESLRSMTFREKIDLMKKAQVNGGEIHG